MYRVSDAEALGDPPSKAVLEYVVSRTKRDAILHFLGWFACMNISFLLSANSVGPSTLVTNLTGGGSGIASAILGYHWWRHTTEAEVARADLKEIESSTRQQRSFWRRHPDLFIESAYGMRRA